MFIKILKRSKSLIFARNYAKQCFVEMKYLNVAEKHDAAKTIAGLLSKGTARRREGFSKYNKIFDFEADVKGKNCKMVMTSVSGHLLSLEFLQSYRNWKTVDPKSLFDAPVRKRCTEDYEPIKRTLEREIKTCQGLIVWTDCDREGENIGFEIISVCRAIRPNITVYRAIFSEITSRSVHRALQTLITPDKRQSDAVDVRTELDLRSGAAITRYQTMRLQRLFPSKIADNLISYGSCQIPTLGFVVERYKEVDAFVSEPFWKIKVLHTIEDLTVEFNWSRNRLFDKQLCEDYFLLCLTDPKATVEKVTVKPKSKWRPTPMDTVDLEKLGSRKLKLSAKETMNIAEKLYTKGLISYPRTETNQFSKEIDLRTLVEQQTGHGIWGSFAQRVVEWGPNPRNGNKSDQAHPPIHPTKMVSDLQGNEGRVYELICRHFLACVSKDAVGSETIVNIDIAGEKFHANGLCIYERNYLDVYVYDKWTAKQIHKYEQGQQFDPTEISMPEGATTAPPLLTEADLIGLMEKHGIGTDATHAEHINTIKERGYIGVVENGFLVPGVIGMGLYEGYDAMNLVLAKPVLRAEFEADLKKVCMGEKDPKQVLSAHIEKYKEAYKQITEKISAMDEKVALRISETPAINQNHESSDIYSQNNDIAQELFKCPKCENANLALRQKKNKNGFFIGCMSFPDCKHYIGVPDEFKEPSVKNELCPKCGVKLLKIKFQSVYFKTLFNTPNGWYKTCLICDNKLQNTFNINLESVKRLGAIVNDHIETSRTQSNTTSQRVTSLGCPDSNSQGTASTSNKSHSQSDPKTKKNQKLKSATCTNKQKTQPINNIRTYFTVGNSGRTLNEDTQTAQEATDSFCNSVDDLDLLLAAASNTNITSAYNSNENQGSNINNDLSGEICNDIEDIFGNDDADDALFAALEFDNGQPQNTRNLNHHHHPQAHRQNYEHENSFIDMLRDGEESNEDYIWGTAARRKRLSEIMQPNKKLCSENLNNAEFFQSTDEKIVQCNGCHQPAKRLTVRSESVNKGRDYYICSKQKPCKYFQWADEQPSTSNNQTTNAPNDILVGTNSVQDNSIDVKCNCGNTATCKTVRKDGPNKGRPFLTCADRDKSCGFFQWGDETALAFNGERNTNDDDEEWGSGSTKQNPSHTTSLKASRNIPTVSHSSYSWGTQNMPIKSNRVSDAVEVTCNCGGTARSFTVRKDGPNKGRTFKGCANLDKSCGFFQWSDENETSAAGLHNGNSDGWGSASTNSRSSQSQSQNKQQGGTKGARKCGICRKEGHTKQKCPRREEFNS